MSTENENWQDAKPAQENPQADRDGNQFEGTYNRPSYNREGTDRPRRPRFNPQNSDRPQRSGYGSSDRPYRPRYNADGNNQGGDRPYRPRYNSDGNSYQGNSDRPYRPRYNADGNNQGSDRPYRPRYNSDGNSYQSNDRPQRSYGNSYQGGDRPQRRYNPNGGNDRQQRSYGNSYQGDRPQRSYNNQGGDRPYRPRYNADGEGDRPQRGGYGQQSGDRPYRSQRTGYGPQGGGNFRPHFNSGYDNRGGNYGNRGGNNFRRQQGGGSYDPNAKYTKKKQIEYKEQYVDPNEPIRLNKFLANAGICSRREADEFITAGVVSVNGEVVTELGTKIKRSDEVKFHDQPVSIERKIYVLLNKPRDTVTTSDDPQARRTVMDLVKGACQERIYPVGRLDRNTTGVLLLTNDGDLASKLTHPKYMKKKVYHVCLDKNLTKADMDQIATGITIDDEQIHADAISYTDENKKDDIGIEIHSGKNRIIRRIFETLGYKVIKLDRVLFAGLTKKGLRRGEWRYLTEQEVNFLRMGSFE